MTDPAIWEGVAAAVLAPIGDLHLDPRHICTAYDLTLEPVADTGRSACTRGSIVRYPILAPLQRQAGVIAHELGHVALRDHGEDWRDERAAAYVGAAILVPRRPLLSALRRYGADLDALSPLFEHASPELLMRRVAEVSDYAVTVVSGRKVVRHALHAPWVRGPLEPWERDLADVARADGYAERANARAWRVEWPGYEHVLIVRSAA